MERKLVGKRVTCRGGWYGADDGEIGAHVGETQKRILHGKEGDDGMSAFGRFGNSEKPKVFSQYLKGNCVNFFGAYRSQPSRTLRQYREDDSHSTPILASPSHTCSKATIDRSDHRSDGYEVSIN
jgi:hypothetical protein